MQRAKLTDILIDKANRRREADELVAQFLANGGKVQRSGGNTVTRERKVFIRRGSHLEVVRDVKVEFVTPDQKKRAGCDPQTRGHWMPVTRVGRSPRFR